MHRILLLLALGTAAACGKGRDEAPKVATPPAEAKAPVAPATAKAAESDAAPAVAPTPEHPAQVAPAGPVRASALTIEIVEGISEEGGAGVSVSLEAELLEDSTHPLPRLELAIACRVGSSVERQSVAVILPRAGERRRVSHTFWQDQPLEEPPPTCEARAAFAEGNAKGRVGQPIQLAVACWNSGTPTENPCTPDLAATFDGE